MREERTNRLKEDAVPIGLAVLLHVALGVLLVVGSAAITARPNDTPGRGTKHEPIQATVVKESDYQAAQAEIEKSQQTKEKHAQALQQQASASQAAQKKAQQELAQLKKQREQADKQAAAKTAAQQKQLTEIQQKLAAAKKQREAQEAATKKAQEQAEKAKKAREAEQTRIAKEKAAAKAKAEAEAKKKAEAKAEAKKKAEAKAKAQAKKKAEDERKLQMQAGMAAEANARIKHSQGAWIDAITATVQRNWNKPASTPPGLDCTVKITLLPSGEVTNATMLQCNGNGVVEQSIITAIYKSSPLPTPSDPAAFENVIKFEFIPGQTP
ncbi:MAG: cell envelope integrity protein TolA [Gammaproteobacteria bacterium]